jgi:hypothetical protein
LNSIIKKTNKLLIQFLKFVAKTIAEQLLKIGIVALIGLVALYGLYAPARDFLLELFQLPIATLPKELLLYHLLLLIIIVSFLIWLIQYIRTKINRKILFDFIEVGGLSWARNTGGSQVGIDPHCPQHHVQLIKDERHVSDNIGNYEKVFSFYCPLCNEFVKKDVRSDELEIWREIANNIAHAKYYGYLKKSKH